MTTTKLRRTGIDGEYEVLVDGAKVGQLLRSERYAYTTKIVSWFVYNLAGERVGRDFSRRSEALDCLAKSAVVA